MNSASERPLTLGGLMPKGQYPVRYFADPRGDLPIERVYVDMDAYTLEYFEDEPEFHERIDFFVVLPPLLYEGQFLKGVFVSQAVDFLHKLYPQLGCLFFSVANSQWCNFPWSRRADGYYCLYSNPEREAWFRQRHPDRADKLLLPLQDADCTHEYVMAPVPFVERDVDVVCVSRLHDLKNVPLIAEALRVFRRKYRPVRMRLIVGKPFDSQTLAGLTEHELSEWRKVEACLERPDDYLQVVPQANYSKELPSFYSRAKLCVLGSLLEGKNRSLYEAMSCNTPVVCFRAFNQFIRGTCPAFPDGAGLYAPEFDAESLADIFQQVFKNHGDFRPRRRFLETSGRKNSFDRCLDSFPYYETALPDFVRGQHVRNLWLDLAIQDNYQLSLLDFVYATNTLISHVRGLKAIDQMLRFYFSRFGLAP